MSDAGLRPRSDLFGDEPDQSGIGAAVLHELGLMRRVLEAIRSDLEAIRQEVEASAAARPTDASLSAVAAPLAAGGGVYAPEFPTSFRGRTGGGG